MRWSFSKNWRLLSYECLKEGFLPPKKAKHSFFNPLAYTMEHPSVNHEHGMKDDEAQEEVANGESDSA